MNYLPKLTPQLKKLISKLKKLSIDVIACKVLYEAATNLQYFIKGDNS